MKQVERPVSCWTGIVPDGGTDALGPVKGVASQGGKILVRSFLVLLSFPNMQHLLTSEPCSVLVAGVSSHAGGRLGCKN